MGLRETLERLSQPDLSGDPRVAAEFDAAVEVLFERVEAWLAPLRQDGSVAVARSRFDLVEEGYRPRGMPALDLVTLGHPIALRPVAAQVVGARGRVDMSSDKDGGTAVRILLDPRAAPGWCAPDPDGTGFTPLDRRAFLRILEDLTTPAPEPEAVP